MQRRNLALTLRVTLAGLIGLWWGTALHAQEPQAESLVPLAEEAPLVVELRSQLEQRAGHHASQLLWPQLTSFYSARDYQPVWVDAYGTNARANILLTTLQQARDEGLEPSVYPLPLLAQLSRSQSPGAQISFELLLTSTFFDYSRELLSGQREPMWSGQLWYIAVDEPDSVALLQALLASDDFALALQSLPPNHPAYQRLREALARYRQMETAGGWPSVPAGKKLRVGIEDPRVPLLRQRLQLEGELQFAPVRNPLLYDPALRYAVERFQLRHGLVRDGVVGPLTLAELNLPLSRRISQIRLNMERWRWLPDQLGHRHIIVNVSAYQLSAYDHGERRLSMEAIIGTLENPTPQISGKLHTIVFNPYWSIPRRIALEEVVPKQQRDPDYLASRGIRVFSDWSGGEELPPESINWSQLHWGNFPYMLRQDPGSKNPLGKLKFLFTNNFRVYLHDTPAQQLFNQPERAFSHGCIRVKSPIQLASYLLANEPASLWNDEALLSAVSSTKTREVKVSQPVPVYLLYLTAWVGDDGAVHFRKDLYGEDEMLLIELPDGELD